MSDRNESRDFSHFFEAIARARETRPTTGLARHPVANVYDATATTAGESGSNTESSDLSDRNEASGQLIGGAPRYSSSSTIGTTLAADIVIVTALPEEKTAVLLLIKEEMQDVLAKGVLFKLVSLPAGRQGEVELRIAVVSQPGMGMVPASILTTKALDLCRPRYVILTGICATVEGRASYGDIIVGDSIFDYGSGKIIGGRLHPDYFPLPAASSALELVRDCGQADQSLLLHQISAEWPDEGSRPQNRCQLHIGPFASGAAVVADGSIVEGIVEHRRTLMGIDMEAYGVARAVHEDARQESKALIVKGVTDYGTVEKNDRYRSFASYASARFALTFMRRYWSELRDV